MLLSIIIPTYNEGKTIIHIVDRVVQLHLPDGLSKEIIIIDDGSTDDTELRILDYQNKNSDLKLTYKKLDQNRGKGAAVRAGFKMAKGDYVIIQDADLEYNPADYPKLLVPLLENETDVVYGSRFKINSQKKSPLFYLGNLWLTRFSNVFTGLKLTDMETCYKVFRKDILEQLKLQENGFGLEPEITCKLAKIKDIRIQEVPITYSARTHRDGKKIKYWDGIRAVYCIFKYGLFE